MSVLSGILKVDKDTKKAFLSIDATLQKIYKIEEGKNKRDIKQRKEELQAKKTQEKEKNILEDILGELKNNNKKDKKQKSLMEELFDVLKGPLLAFGGTVAGAIGTITSAIAPFVIAIAGAAAALKGLSDFGNMWKGSQGKPGLASKLDFGKKGADLGQRIRDEKESKNYQRGAPGYRQRSEWESGNAMQYGLTSAYDRDKMRGQFEELLIDLKADETKALEEARPKVSKKTNRGIVEEKGTIDPKVKEKIEKEYERRRASLEQRYIEMFGPGGSAEKKQRGGPITIPGSGSGDKVPMMLPPGAFVMNRNASAMLQNGGLVPTLLEPGEKVFGPGDVSPMHHMINSMIPRFQEGGVVKDTYGKESEEGILPSHAKTTPAELKMAKLLEKFSGKAMGGEIQSNPKKGIYIEGGREGYDPHYHINRADQANYSRTALDSFVKVNGRSLSSGTTVSGGEYGASRDRGARKHTGIDFAFGGGKELSLVGGAEWLSNAAVSGIGDKTSFKTPIGVFEVIHGTYKGNALPGSWEGDDTRPGSSNIAMSVMDQLMNSVSGMGDMGKLLGGMLGKVNETFGPLLGSLFNMSPAMAAGSGQPTTGAENITSGGTADTTLTPNRKAMLDAIAMAEGTNKYPDNGYKTMFTGKQFSAPPWTHPRQIQRSGRYASDAAGRYQFLSTTWNPLGLPDFSPINQDKGAIKLLQRRNALGHVDSGKWEQAFNAAKGEWASFPGAGYNQPEKDMKTMVAYSQATAKKYGAPEAKMQTGGLVNMSGAQSAGTTRFKQAQEEFAQMIADKAGAPIIINTGSGSSSRPTIIPSGVSQPAPPSLPTMPTSLAAAAYWNQLAMQDVC